MRQPFQLSRWWPARAIQVDPDGKHRPAFPEQFPLVIMGYILDADFSITPNYHDYMELTLIHGGTGAFNIGTKRYPACPGDIFVLGNSELHYPETSERGPLRCVCLFFMPELVYQPGRSALDFEYIRPFFAQGEGFDNRIPASARVNREVWRLLRDIHRILQRRGLHDRLRAKNRLYELLTVLAEHYAGSVSSSEAEYNRSLCYLNRLKPALSLIWASYGRKLRLSQVAEAAHMSPSYFCKVFKRATGYTFHEYLLRARIDRAKELLLMNEATVTEILYEVGFENSSYFYKEFKRLTRMRPLEFRRRAGE